MRVLLLVPAALVAWLAGPVTSQDTPAATRRFEEGRVFVLDLPADWRRLTPNEAVGLGARLQPIVDPGDARSTQTMVLGAIDRWLEAGFDGRAIVVYSQPFELPTTRETLDEIRSVRDGAVAADGSRQTVIAAELVDIGRDHHPAIEVQVLVQPEDPAGRAMRSWDYYASTTGQRLILSFRTWENAESEVATSFRQMVDSLIFARPPQKPQQLEDKLMWAVILGAVTGLALIVARLLRKRAPTG